LGQLVHVSGFRDSHKEVLEDVEIRGLFYWRNDFRLLGWCHVTRFVGAKLAKAFLGGELTLAPFGFLHVGQLLGAV
jgi:hypothetical protein